MGLGTSISNTSSNGVEPNEEGIDDVGAETLSPFADFINIAHGAATSAKAGLDANNEGIASLSEDNVEVNPIMGGLLEWAS